MSAPPNKRSHEEGRNGSGGVRGSHGLSSASKFQDEDSSTFPGVMGRLESSTSGDYHSPYDIGQDVRMPKLPRTESRDADRRPPLLPMYRVPSSSNDSHLEHPSGFESGLQFRDTKDGNKDPKFENGENKVEQRELYIGSRPDKDVKFDSRGDDNKATKHERETYPEHRADIKVDKETFAGPSNHPNWKNSNEQHRGKRYPDASGGNVDPWQASRSNLHGPVEGVKESPNVEEREYAEAREAVGENKVDFKGEDKLKERDRKRKEVKQRDWVERDKERNDWRNTLQLCSNSSSENKEPILEEREAESLDKERKDLLREKEKVLEREKDFMKKESGNGAEKESPHNDKEMVGVPSRAAEVENPTSELKKRKDTDSWKNVDRNPREGKKERDAEEEGERYDKRNKNHDKESDERCGEAEGSAEREREVFNYGVQQRKRMLRPRGSPQRAHRDPHFRSRNQDNEGHISPPEDLPSRTDLTDLLLVSRVAEMKQSQGKPDVSTIVYRVGECMQELTKVWKEYEASQADKMSESSSNGPTLDIRIPAEHVSAANRQVRGGQLWGTDIYTDDSDLVAVLMHTGYCRPTASPPEATIQELRVTIRVLPPQDCYVSTLRNNVRSRAWGAAVGCSYRVEHCCVMKKGGAIFDMQPCLAHSSSMEPTLAPVAVERTMTTRAAASNALRQQRFVREVTVQFNLCGEPWLKYSISVVADKGLKKPLLTASRLKKGEVLYLETHSRRFELCFAGEKMVKATSMSQAHEAEADKSVTHNSHASNGEKGLMDGESVVIDAFRWSHCKNLLRQTKMLSIGIPLPLEHLEVLEDNLEWEDINWTSTGAVIAGKDYHLARAHFMSPN